METIKAHRSLLKAASTFGEKFHRAIKSNGVISLPEKRFTSLLVQLSRGVVGQQLSGAAARSIWGRIEHSANSSGIDIRQYLLNVKVSELRQFGISKAKCRALMEIRARLEDDPAYSESALANSTNSERANLLTQIWGIGQWTADMAAIFYFREPDIWPTSDGAVSSGVLRLVGKSRFERQKLDKIGAPFAPFRSYLALHIWRAIDSQRI